MEGAQMSVGSSVTESERSQYKSGSERDSPPAERRQYKNACERDSPPAHHSVRGNKRDCDRDTPSVERHPLIAENGRERPVPQRVQLTSSREGDRQLIDRHGHVRGRRDDVLDSYRDGLTSLREESVRAALVYERAPYEGSPHPISGYERLSVDRAHTMKDFEKQITELKKENFNLKLRIYFLEEQVQRCCDTSNDELHRMNIELKVEVESLKHDFQEKHDLLVRASKAMESLSGEHNLAIQRLRDEHLRHLQDMEDACSQKLHLLETELEHEKAELEKVCVLLDQERVQRFTAEERLMAVNDQYTKSMTILEERDWIIQCLNETVHSKDALIAQLEKQIASMMPYQASSDKTGQDPGNLYLENDAKDSPEPPNPIHNVDVTDGKEENINEWQKKIKEMDNLINELQKKLEANKAGSATEEKNFLKRDKAIQGLTLALKKKTKENDKLLNEIDNLNASLSKAREAAQLQNLKENIHPDYKKLMFTLQAEQDMYSRLLKYEQESGSLQKELESITMLRRWLEENIQANQELRKIMEAQIMAKYKGEDSMSFLGDQTSYLSICLDHLDQNEYFFAGGPQSKNNLHIGEVFNHLREETGTQTQSEVSVSGANVKHHHKDDDERSTLQGEDEVKATKNKQNTVTSATQTEPRIFTDKCLAGDVSRLPKKRAELMWTQDGELNVPSQRLVTTHAKTSNNICEIQGHNFCPNVKKSRLPVLLKSSLNTKLKTDAALTLAKENDHNCLENLYEQVKCAEMVDLIKDNHIPYESNQGQEQRDPTERHRLSQEPAKSDITEKEDMWRCTESDSNNSRQKVSTEQVIKELEAENYQLPEQLTRAPREVETLKANEELIKHKDALPELLSSNKVQTESTDRALQKELQAENCRLSEQLKRAQVEIETLKANEELLRCKVSEHDLHNSKDEQRKIEQTLQAENYRLSEQLKRAQMEIETLRANEELLNCKALHNSKDEQRKSTEQTLQAENYRLSEQLKRAQVEIETLKANEELLNCKALHNSKDEQRKSTEQTLQAENYRLSEQLKRAQVEIETLKANEELLRCKVSECDLRNSKIEQRKSTEQTLQAEYYRLSEHLKRAQVEIETLKANEELLSCKALHNSKDEQRKTEQTLQAENSRLSEHLKRAQVEIETLKANEEFIKYKDIVPGLSYSLKDQMESPDQSLQKELQAEKCRLSEQLKTAQMHIEKLESECRSTVSSDDSLKLHGSDADDDLSEQSFLDKTITNSVHVNDVDATSDFGDEVSRPNVISQNAVALRCHHDSHCMECANNRGILSLPTSDSKKASTMHTSSKITKVSSRRSFEDTSLSKYDLLVQSQARELSLQRQKIKESHNLSVICSKNFYNILKAFDNLFPGSALDSNITLGFQEQITQTVEWLKELEYKLSDAFYGEEDAYSDQSVDSLLYTPSRLVPGHRMWADKHGCHILGLVEDYNALRKQILEARNVLQEMEAFIDHGVQTAVLNMTEHFGDIFFEKLTRTKQSLEEAGCLLKLLWRVSLPSQIHSPYTINQEEDVNLEVTRLRKRVLEQEKLLSGMVKRVYSENQMKEDIEKLILNQLAMTHDILKKAKGNLEVQVVEKLL